MDQEFLNSRLFRHRLYFKTDIYLSINPDLIAPGTKGQPQPSWCGGGGVRYGDQPGQVGGVNNKIFRTHR